MAIKGQKQPQETVDKCKRANLTRILAKYKWEAVEQFLDVNLELSTRNRKHKFITLRQFKQYCLEGFGINDISKMDICRNLLQFFANLCQSKISLTKEVFEEQYKSGKSLEQIAKDNKITREDITFLRQLYGIKALGPTFQNRKATEVPLTQRQKEIVYGSLMGDAKKTSSSSAGFGHGNKQKEYLFWKYSELESVASMESLKPWHSVDRRTGKRGIKWCFYTYANTDIENIIKEFYNEEKEVSDFVLSQLTPLGIAVWYMDDGRTDWCFARRMKFPNRTFSPELFFCTDSFSLLSCEKIINWFKNRWDITTHTRFRKLSKNGIPQYRVVINKCSNEKFIDLINPYIIPSMRYKVDYNEYLIWRKKYYCSKL